MYTFHRHFYKTFVRTVRTAWQRTGLIWTSCDSGRQNHEIPVGSYWLFQLTAPLKLWKYTNGSIVFTYFERLWYYHAVVDFLKKIFGSRHGRYSVYSMRMRTANYDNLYVITVNSETVWRHHCKGAVYSSLLRPICLTEHQCTFWWLLIVMVWWGGWRRREGRGEEADATRKTKPWKQKNTMMDKNSIQKKKKKKKRPVPISRLSLYCISDITLWCEWLI